MKRKFLILGILAFCLGSPYLFAKESAGTGGASFLLIPMGVRLMGMGGAGVAVPSGVNSIAYNPGLATHIRRTEIALTHQELFLDTSMNFAGFAKPLDIMGINELGGASLFAQALYLDKGNIEINTLNANGTLASSELKSAGYDLAVGVGYAEYFLRGSFGIEGLEEGTHSLGLMLQGIRSNLVETYDAYAGSVNLGYFGNFRRFGVGLSIAHLGSKLKFLEQGDPLPVVFRAGFAYRMGVAPASLLWAYDIVHQEEAFHHRAGAELVMARAFAFRAGYLLEPEGFRGGPTFGFGLNLGLFFFEYAYSWFGDLRENHRALFGMRFGRLHR